MAPSKILQSKLFIYLSEIILDEFCISLIMTMAIFSALKGSPLIAAVISALVLMVYLLLIRRSIHYKKRKLWLLWGLYRNMTRNIDKEEGKRIVALFISREKNLEHRRVLEKYSQILIDGEV
ncbi:hypothetical protein TEU_02385 [Thermococcus eurythermalis]|uniref:Uncharacterized protein n=2 Tax=Thermococcus eurythermalis TaxID=1505907 RepID=A0A097QS24_9EURY|nr:hypothetical protein TEU_02385 [Thermococcus eurythermalis]